MSTLSSDLAGKTPDEVGPKSLKLLFRRRTVKSFTPHHHIFNNHTQNLSIPSLKLPFLKRNGWWRWKSAWPVRQILNRSVPTSSPFTVNYLQIFHRLLHHSALLSLLFYWQPLSNQVHGLVGFSRFPDPKRHHHLLALCQSSESTCRHSACGYIQYFQEDKAADFLLGATNVDRVLGDELGSWTVGYGWRIWGRKWHLAN